MSEIYNKFKFGKVLDSGRLTQKFGENALPMYQEMGLKGHNGTDWAVPKGTQVFAPIDMLLTSAGGAKNPDGSWVSGYGIQVKGFTDALEVDGVLTKLELVMAHLDSTTVKVGSTVQRGVVVGYADSTGLSTGNHLHFGVRPYYFKGGAWVIDYNNGYFGYIDPQPFFAETLEELPEFAVDNRYGTKRTWASYLREKWVLMAYTSKVGKLPTIRQINALAYGYWDLETIQNQAMFQTWRDMTKPEYLKRLGL